MTSWAKLGVKCVYIGAAHKHPVMRQLNKNATYTIRGIVEHPVLKKNGLYLEEVTNPVSEHFGLEHAYSLKNFRPLISQSDDIAMFMALLEPAFNPQYIKDVVDAMAKNHHP